jgi:nicotinate-nucleotide adenylyltransferase
VDGPAERLGVLGGTFDPPHVGHLAAAAGARHALGLDRVLLVVANRPWQKVDDRRGIDALSPPADRLAMVEALVEGTTGLIASDLELRRGGDSYTVDTLDELARTDPGARRFLILGADAAAGLSTWDRADALPSLATLALVARAGTSAVDVPAGWIVERVEIPRLDISSSDLRARVAEGRPLDGLTPPGVISLIEQRRLYRGRP